MGLGGLTDAAPRGDASGNVDVVAARDGVEGGASVGANCGGAELSADDGGGAAEVAGGADTAAEGAADCGAAGLLGSSGGGAEMAGVVVGWSAVLSAGGGAVRASGAAWAP